MANCLDVDKLIWRITNYNPCCNISLEQGLPYERDIALLLSTLKTRNLYKLNIEQILTKLQTIINEIPFHTKYNLLNKYYSHSWVSHVSYRYNLTPLSIFVSLLKKYVIRKKFHVLWNIIVLLLENGAFPLLNPVQNDNINENSDILSLELIWNLYLNLFNFIDDENEVLKRISFVFSFIDKFEFNTFIIDDLESNRYYYNITSLYPSIFRDNNIKTLPGTQHNERIPSPLFLCGLLEFGSFPVFNKHVSRNEYYFSFAKYHQLFIDKKLNDLKISYSSLEKGNEKYPALIDGIYDIIIGMAFGDKLINRWRYFDDGCTDNLCYKFHPNDTNENGYYLYHLFGLSNKEWIKWSFDNIWKYKTEKELKEITDKLVENSMYLSKWSGRIRELSCYFCIDFIRFYFKIVSYQKSLNGTELSLWMKKYENNAEILQLLFKTQKYYNFDYIMNENFVNNKLFEHFWNILCYKTLSDSSLILRLLIKHLIDLSILDNIKFEYIWKPLFDQFCDKYNGLNWKLKNNLISNMIELLQKWKLNGLEIVNTYFGLKCIFNGSSSQIFKKLTDSNHNLLNIKEIENNNNGSIDIIFDIFRERGRNIQSRHKKMIITYGKWIIDNSYKHKIIEFIQHLLRDCQQIENNDALKQKQSVMIKRFQIEWNLR